MFMLGDHTEKGMIPFFIDWGEAPHAAGKLPIVGSKGTLKVTAPEESHVHKLLDGIEGVEVSTGDTMLEYTFTSAKGTHTFSTDDPLGISFPF
jgi:hypothetical protein